MRFSKAFRAALLALAMLLPLLGVAADRDGDSYSDDAEILSGSNPDNPNSRPIGFVANTVRVEILRQDTKAVVMSRPNVNVLRLGTGADGSGGASVIAKPQINLLRMSTSSTDGNGYASVIGSPAVFYKRSDADFESSLDPFVGYSRSSSKDWAAGLLGGQNAATISNIGGGNAADDWLISPPRSVDNGDRVAINFDYFQQGQDNPLNQGAATPTLQVLVSTNYTSGDPLGATWTNITPPGLDALPSGVWNSLREATFSGVSGTNVRIAFRYRSSGFIDGQAKTIGVDNIYILDKLYQPPAILGFLADGVEIQNGVEFRTQPLLSVTSANLNRADKAQFLQRPAGTTVYSLIGEDANLSDGASLSWRLGGLAVGGYDVAARLWSGPNYTEVVRSVTVSYTDSTGPQISNWLWNGSPFSNGLVVDGAGTVGVTASDPADVSRVEFFAKKVGETVETPIGSDSNAANGFTATWGIAGSTTDGDYTIVAKAYDSLGNESTDSRNLRLMQLKAPAFTTQPASQTILNGATATLSVAATGFPLPSFQWYRGARGDTSAPVSDAIGASFTTPSLAASTSYWVRASNTKGSADSDTAAITVTNPAPVLRLSFSPLSIEEGKSTTGTITLQESRNEDLLVILGTTQPGRVTFPGTVTIPARTLSATFSVQSTQNDNFGDSTTATLIASATGASAASASVQIADDDTPNVGFVLSRTSVAEGEERNSVSGRLSVNRASASAIKVVFAASPTGQVTFPPEVSIPANAQFVDVPISVNDNDSLDGNRVVSITASLTSQNITIASASPVDLAITDDEAPSIFLAFDRSLFVEGTNPSGTGYVSRNTGSGQALTVTLTSDKPAKVVVPETVTIPAGKDSASFPIQALDDGIPQNPENIGLTATASDHNSGTALLSITDVRKPDLVVDFLNPPTGAESNSWIDVPVVIMNQGSVDASGPFTQRVLLSKDDAIGDDELLAEANFSGIIKAGLTTQQSLRVKLPDKSGRFWLVAQTDAKSVVSEALEENNTTVAAVPLDIAPAYNATLSVAQTRVASGVPISIVGTAILARGGAAANMPVKIHITNGPVRRVISTLTDGAGSFTATFTPLPGEGGLFLFGAAHPSAVGAPVQDQVEVYGIAVEPSPLAFYLAENDTQTGTLTIRNLTNLPVTGIVAVASNLPSGIGFTAIPAASSIASSGSLAVNFTITSQTRIDPADFTLNVTSAEGATVTVPVTVIVEANAPKLVVEPARIEAGMVRGGQQIVTFVQRNEGNTNSGPVNVRLPASASWMRLSTPMPLAPLAPGDEIPITLQLIPDANLPLGEYAGSLVATDGVGASVAIPFSFLSLSDRTGQLTVRAEDEYTYYASGNPYLANATVRVSNVVTNQILEPIVTGMDGVANFGQVPEGYYDIEVYASKHTGFKKRLLIRSGVTNSIAAFLSRQTVTYKWSVVPIFVEDRYQLTVETQFEAFIPIPVVTVEPSVIDVSLITADESVVDVVITNHGLIAAEATQINFPDHPLWQFTPAIKDVGLIPANSSVTVPVTVRRVARKARQSAAVFVAKNTASAAASDSEGDGPCFAEASVCWELKCGGRVVTYCVPVPIPNLRSDCWGEPPPSTPPCVQCVRLPDTPRYDKIPYLTDSPWPRIPTTPCPDWVPAYLCSSNGDTEETELYVPPIEGTSVCELATFGYCDTCLGQVAIAACECAFKLVPGLNPFAKCGKGAWDCAASNGNGWTCVKANYSCAKALGVEFAEWLSAMKKAIDLLECGAGIVKVATFCLNPKPFEEPTIESLTRKSLSAQLAGNAELPPSVLSLVESYEQLASQLEYSRYMYGSFNWFDTGGGDFGVWLSAFDTASEDGSAGGRLVAVEERAEVLALPLPGSVTRGEAELFIDRYNRSIQYWEARIFVTADVPAGQSTDFLDQGKMADLAKAALAASNAVEAGGYESSFEAIRVATENFLAEIANTPPSPGVCAKVRLKIDQEAVFARDAFRASLNLENTGDAPLENVEIQINVRTADGVSSSNLFSIQQNRREGISAVDGSSVLDPSTAALLEWTIIPTLDAAPQNPTDYLVSGTMSYIVEGQAITIPFADQPITVLPIPQLTLKYFHQRDVLADDPFTSAIEPSQPYALAVMVQNNGAGTARDFRITSAQPTIIENEKGLLADFKIIATQVDTTPVQPSLTVNFGDVEPGQIKIGQWLFTSTLQGLFTDYSADFKHIDDAGIERFSLISDVEIHEMISQVRALGVADDGLPDFLVNDIPDSHDLPDTIYLSDGTIEPVTVVETAQTTGQLTKTLTTTLLAGWAYLRVPEPSNGQYELTKVVRSDGLDIPLDVNAWVTDRTFVGLGLRPVSEYILHLVDHDSTGSYTLTYQSRLLADTATPTSQVNALPGQSGAEFEVIWASSDDRRVAHVDVYVSVDSGPYSLWAQRSIESGAVFQGELGRAYRFYSRATDAAGNTELVPSVADAETTVAFGNLAPTLTEILDQQVSEGEVLGIALNANDPDGRKDLLSFRFSGSVPTGLTINSRTGFIQWATGETDGGRIETVEVKATDAGSPSLSVTRSFRISVIENNLAPVIESVSPQRSTVGGLFSLQVKARDNDLPTQSLVYAFVSSPPEGMTISLHTGLILWQPSSLQSDSTFPITVTVSDTGNPPRTSLLRFPITVEPLLLDRAPVFDLKPLDLLLAGLQYTTEITAYDPDGDALTLELATSGLPGILDLQTVVGTGRGLLSWNTTGVASGLYGLVVQATAGGAITEYTKEVKLVPNNAYWKWAVENFKGLNDPAASDPGSNIDGDNESNLFEWAHLRDPLNYDTTKVDFSLEGPYAGGWYAARLDLFRRRGSNQFVTLAPQGAEDLREAWRTIPSTDFEVSLDPDGDSDGKPETEEIRFRIWLNPDDPAVKAKFFRIQSKARSKSP